jgi:signal transduction histidine kinase
VISEQASERAGVLSAVRLAQFLWAFSVGLVAISAVLLALNRGVEDPVAPYWINLVVSALALSTVGALVASRRPENPIGWLLLSSGLLYAVMVSVGEYGAYALLTERGALPGGVLAAWLGSWLYVLGGNLVLYSFLFFPDGRLPSPRWHVVAWLVALAMCLDTVVLALTPGTLYGYPGVGNPFGIEAFAGLTGPIGVVVGVLALAAILAPVIALIVRFRRARGDERQQIKWVAYAVAVLVTVIVAVNLWPALDPSLVGVVMFLVGFLAIPAAIGVAIFKYRLYDIDLVINRTLVYGALTACIVGIYVLVVGYLGALFRTGGSLAISLIATGIVAVLFAPLRDRLQRGVNRLMYGERDEPYSVISRLGERLEATLAPDAALPAIVETVREALKLPYAAIALPRDGGFEVAAASGESPAASRGQSSTDPLVLPLHYGGEAVGQLLLAPRGPGEGFSADDRRLLDGLARHAGVAVHGVRVMADLRRSRESLVLTREEERRRLRRDLHDELAPTLAALGLTAATVGELIPTDPKEAAAANERLRTAIRTTVGDVRRLVYDLRPPALDELGLVEAIKERATRFGTGDGDFRATVEAPERLPNLPAAVEVAAYRITQEALTNVARHARASVCTVRLACYDSRAFTIEVTDNGVGLPERPQVGVGLSSMRERAAELGGTCEITSTPPSGTRVFARLPIEVSGLGQQVSEHENPKADS